MLAMLPPGRVSFRAPKKEKKKVKKNGENSNFNVFENTLKKNTNKKIYIYICCISLPILVWKIE